MDLLIGLDFRFYRFYIWNDVCEYKIFSAKEEMGSVASYAGLKMDLKTNEAVNDIISRSYQSGKCHYDIMTFYFML